MLIYLEQCLAHAEHSVEANQLWDGGDGGCDGERGHDDRHCSGSFYTFNSFSPHRQHCEVLQYYYPHFSQEETVAHGG